MTRFTIDYYYGLALREVDKKEFILALGSLKKQWGPTEFTMNVRENITSGLIKQTWSFPYIELQITCHDYDELKELGL